MQTSNPQCSVLFVCLGNICRSPTAHGVFEKKLKQQSLQDDIAVDSCGTAAYHIGKPPDSRSMEAARSRGYKLDHLRARQLSREDFYNFDYILAMDEENLSNATELAPPESQADVSLFLSFHPEEHVLEVPDPYYGGEQGFEYVLDLVEVASDHLLEHIRRQHLVS